MLQPVIRVQHVRGLADHVQVEVRIRIVPADQAQHALAGGHAAHDVAVADLEQVRIPRRVGLVVVADERRLPNLDGMVFPRLVLAFEINQLAVVEQAVAVTDDRRFEPLLDHVIRKQDIDAAFAVVENIEVVLAVGGLDAFFKKHVVELAFEFLVIAGLQVVAVGEDDAVAFRQQDARIFDAVDPPHLLDFFAVDEIAEILFLIRPDL